MIRPDGNRKVGYMDTLFFNLKETSIPLTPRMFLHQVHDGWVFPILKKKKKAQCHFLGVNLTHLKEMLSRNSLVP